MERGWQQDLCRPHEGGGGQEDTSVTSRPLWGPLAVPQAPGWLLPCAACLPASCSHSPVAGTLRGSDSSASGSW